MCKCEHCSKEIRHGDTICIHCGKDITQENYQLKSFRPFVLIGCAFWGVVGLICYLNGWLV